MIHIYEALHMFYRKSFGLALLVYSMYIDRMPTSSRALVQYVHIGNISALLFLCTLCMIHRSHYANLTSRPWKGGGANLLILRRPPLPPPVLFYTVESHHSEHIKPTDDTTTASWPLLLSPCLFSSTLTKHKTHRNETKRNETSIVFVVSFPFS